MAGRKTEPAIVSPQKLYRVWEAYAAAGTPPDEAAARERNSLCLIRPQDMALGSGYIRRIKPR